MGFAVMFSNLPLQTSAFLTAINRPIESVVISLARTLFLIPIITYISILFIEKFGVATGYLIADCILVIELGVFMRRIDISELKIYD